MCISFSLCPPVSALLYHSRDKVDFEQESGCEAGCTHIILWHRDNGVALGWVALVRSTWLDRLCHTGPFSGDHGNLTWEPREETSQVNSHGQWNMQWVSCSIPEENSTVQLWSEHTEAVYKDHLELPRCQPKVHEMQVSTSALLNPFESPALEWRKRKGGVLFHFSTPSFCCLEYRLMFTVKL